MKTRKFLTAATLMSVAGGLAVAMPGVNKAYAECNAERPAIQGQKDSGDNPCATAKPAGKEKKANPCAATSG